MSASGSAHRAGRPLEALLSPGGLRRQRRRLDQRGRRVRVNSCVCEDFRSRVEAGVCELVGAVSAAAGGACAEVDARGIGEGAGMPRGSVTGWAERGASVEIACDPDEYHTKVLVKPVFMIENIRTSKYD